MKKKLIVCILLAAMVLMLCSCSDPDKEAKDEINTVIKNYQEAIIRGDYTAADGYCALENGKAGAWFFHENSVEITEDTPVYVVACQELGDAQFFIDIYNIDVADDTAIIDTCFYQCSTSEAIDALAGNVDISSLENATMEECKEQLKDYILSYTYMFASNVECKKINGEWKITKLN